VKARRIGLAVVVVAGSVGVAPARPAAANHRVVVDPVPSHVAVGLGECLGLKVASKCGPEWAQYPLTNRTLVTPASSTRGQFFNVNISGTPHWSRTTWDNVEGQTSGTGSLCFALDVNGTKSYHHLRESTYDMSTGGGGYPLDSVTSMWMWRPSPGVITSPQLTGSTNDDKCGLDDPGRPPGSDDPDLLARTPSIACIREFTTVASQAGVRVKAKVVNPTPNALDEITIKTAFSTAVHVGTELDSVLPPISTKPEGGWAATCEVTRTLLTGKTPSADWGGNNTHRVTHGASSALPGTPGYSAAALGAVTVMSQADWSAMQDRNLKRVMASASNAQLEAFYKAGGHNPFEDPITGNRLPVPRPSSIPKPPAKGLKVAYDKARRYGGRISEAAAIGWVAGGALTGVAERLGVPGGSEWFCRYNPGYRVANWGECERLTKDVEPGTTSVKDAAGNPIDPSAAGAAPWTTSVATATVRIDPDDVANGGRAAAGTEEVQIPGEAPTGTIDEIQADQGTKASGPQTGTNPAPSEFLSPEENLPVSDPNGYGDQCNISGWAILNPFNIAKHIACELKRLFIPSPGSWSNSISGLSDYFPLNVIQETGQLGDVVVTRMNANLNSSPCATFDYSKALGGNHQILNVKLPTPISANCPYNTEAGAVQGGEKDAGDLFGWRNDLRLVLRVLLYVGFGLALVRAFEPKSNPLDPDEQASLDEFSSSFASSKSSYVPKGAFNK